MSEISNENFGELLDSESSCKTVRQGEIVKGTITYVSDKELQVDLGTSVTGIIKADNIFDDPSAKLTEQFKVGDEVEAKVIRVSDIEGIAELVLIFVVAILAIIVRFATVISLFLQKESRASLAVSVTEPVILSWSYSP